MNNKVAVVGLNENSICFDFEKKTVYLFRKGWASETLGQINIGIPFEKISAVEFIKPTTWTSGKIAFIVNGHRIVTNSGDDATSLSLSEKTYGALCDAVNRLVGQNTSIKLVTSDSINVPKKEEQEKYSTMLNFELFSADIDCPEAVTKTDGVSVGSLIVFFLAVTVICVIAIAIAMR